MLQVANVNCIQLQEFFVRGEEWRNYLVHRLLYFVFFKVGSYQPYLGTQKIPFDLHLSLFFSCCLLFILAVASDLFLLPPFFYGESMLMQVCSHLLVATTLQENGAAGV